MPRTKAQRRSKGDGTVYQTTVRTRRKDGSVTGRVVWRAELEYTDAEDRVQKRSVQRNSEADAKTELRRWLLERAAKGTVAKQREARGPFFEEYADSWLARRKPEIGDSTYRQYTGNLTRLKAFFKGVRLRAITQDHTTRFLSDFQSHRKKGAREHETGETTRKQCLVVLKMILADALAEGVLARMPFETRGRRGVRMRVERREMHVMDREEQRAFLAAASNDRLSALWQLALASGMREGELLALRWKHIKDDHIVVQRRLDSKSKKSKQTKTRASVRRIDLDPITMASLNAHRSRMLVERNKYEDFMANPPQQKRRDRKTVQPPPAGSTCRSEDLVFTNEAGKAISASNLTKRDFKPLLNAAGLSDVFRIHDLRHTHATALLSNGVNPKVVQERLGHENVRTTLDLYGHCLPTSQREAATLTGRLLYGENSLMLDLTVKRADAA